MGPFGPQGLKDPGLEEALGWAAAHRTKEAERGEQPNPILSRNAAGGWEGGGLGEMPRR